MFLGREISRSQDYSEDTARKIDADISNLLRESYTQARKIIEKNRDKLELITKALLERETLDARDVEELMSQGRILSESERLPPPEAEGVKVDPVTAASVTTPPVV